MNFINGQNTDASSVSIRFLANYTKTGICSMYETSNNATIATIVNSEVFKYAGLPNEDPDANTYVRIPKQIITTSTLNDTDNYGNQLFRQVSTYSGLIPYQKYRIYCNSISELKIISAHYGSYYCGGIEFRLSNLIASDNTDYAYMIDFSVINLPLLLEYAKFANVDVNLVQHLSFDIADYADNRRTSIFTIQSDNTYSRLTMTLSLIDNELQISCKDTRGKSVSEHISEDLGLSDTTMECTAKIQMQCINEEGSNVQSYNILAANINYNDDTIAICMPSIVDDAVACSIYVTYNISLYTLSNNITLTSQLILTDEQISNLRPIRLSDLS